jgi:hypothetical protein
VRILAGSIRRVLPVAFLTPAELFSAAGGLAAAIAIGAFFGQGHAVLISASEEGRRRRAAVGGLAGLIVMIGLFLYSVGGG